MAEHLNSAGDCKLDGAVYHTADGTWSVTCTFSQIATEDMAMHISGWLQEVINERLDEIMFETKGRPQ